MKNVKNLVSNHIVLLLFLLYCFVLFCFVFADDFITIYPVLYITRMLNHIVLCMYVLPYPVHVRAIFTHTK
jgi:hypothetical protein